MITSENTGAGAAGQAGIVDLVIVDADDRRGVSHARNRGAQAVSSETGGRAVESQEGCSETW